MKIIASGGVMARCKKGSVRAEGLAVKKNDPPLSKIRIKHYKRPGIPGALDISVGFGRRKWGYPLVIKEDMKINLVKGGMRD